MSQALQKAESNLYLPHRNWHVSFCQSRWSVQIAWKTATMLAASSQNHDYRQHGICAWRITIWGADARANTHISNFYRQTQIGFFDDDITVFFNPERKKAKLIITAYSLLYSLILSLAALIFHALTLADTCKQTQHEHTSVHTNVQRIGGLVERVSRIHFASIILSDRSDRYSFMTEWASPHY